jgi:serine/threonine-protein kinase
MWPVATKLEDRYAVGDLIARGGMADVHAGSDRRLGRDVAIKIMRTGTGADDVAARFAAEARVAAGLQHPKVVAVYDTGETEDGCPYIVLERLPGETLADLIEGGPVPEPVVRAVGEDVLSALTVAHAAGVVHRDIKPRNILRTEDGRWKVADFGIARESDALRVDPTTTNALTGTPAYVAPERIEGSAATAQSDIWSLGVVLYEALAGRKPYEGPGPIAVATAIRDDTRLPLSEARPGVDPALAVVVERAMARDPAQRFPTAVAMAGALHARAADDDDATVVDGTVVDGTLVAAPIAATAAPPLWRRVGARTAMWVLLASVAVLALVGLGVAAGRGANPPSKEPASSVPSPTETTALAPTTTPTTAAVVATPVQNAPVQAPVQVRRHGKRGRKG